MTAAEVAALRERLTVLRTRHRRLADGIVGAEVHRAAADGFDAALALLDAQAAEIARLTAERDAALERARITQHEKMIVLAAYEQALAPAPAAEVAG